MKLMIVGGAGYVGSHFVKEALAIGHECVVYDNLERGHQESVPKKAQLVVGDINDPEAILEALTKHLPDVVLHYAAYALVPESVSDPYMYYHNNVSGVMTLINAMKELPKVPALVFSSSCAVFGTPRTLPMKEADPKLPESPYGWSKYMAEQVIADCAKAFGFSAMALRYFNACGADASGQIGEDHVPETHLIPNVIKAALSGEKLKIFGDDYDTPDGSCVRDYIHVTDLAISHLKACDFLTQKATLGAFYDVHIGTGQGYSNLEIMKTVEKISGQPVAFDIEDRREGDPAQLYADNTKAKELLEFTPTHSGIDNIIGTALNWHKNNMNGYK